MYSYIVDENGNILEAVVDPENYENSIVVSTQIPNGMVSPQWNGTQWVETASLPTEAELLVSLKLDLAAKVDNKVGETFWSTLTSPLGSSETKSYILLAHMFKGMEAQDFINDRDTPAIPFQPTANTAANAAKEHKILFAEAAKRGISESAMADLIQPWAIFQWDFIAGLENLRAPAKDAISAAVDATSAQAAYDQFETDLAAYLATLVLPS